MDRITRGGTALAACALLAAAVLAGCSNSSNDQASTTSSTRAAVTTTTASSTTSTSAGAASTSTTAAAAAPCTQSAILTAAQADAGLGSVQSVVNFGCAGSWAYANVTVGSGAAAYDAVIVLQAQGSTWAVQDRANACTNHLVPSDLYTQACTTS